MTMKDRYILQQTIASCARVQGRADSICLRRKGENTKELDAALANDDRKEVKPRPAADFDRSKLSHDEETYLAAAVDVLKTYGGREALDVVRQRTGASVKAGARALDLARKLGAEVKPSGQPACAECGKTVATWSMLLEEGHCSEECYLKAKQRQEPLATPGEEIALEHVAVGQRFRCTMKPYFDYAGVVLYKTPSRVSVLLDAGAKKLREFTSGGKTVTFESAGRERRNMAPDTVVTPLKETEDCSLLSPKDQVQKKGSSVQEGMEAIMAKEKKSKAAKKTNGAAEAKPSKRAEFQAKTIKVLAEENPKRAGSASHKRFALYKSGMTVGAFIEKGGTLSDIHYDTAKKLISVS